MDDMGLWVAKQRRQKNALTLLNKDQAITAIAVL
jgi:hypothetical protein